MYTYVIKIFISFRTQCTTRQEDKKNTHLAARGIFAKFSMLNGIKLQEIF